MKRVTIVGAGIAGLRAAYELVESGRFNVTIVDKAVSVGGRVANRRFENSNVNHGTLRFDGVDRVTAIDQLAASLGLCRELPLVTTELPKALRDNLLRFEDRFTLRTNWSVSSVGDGEVSGPQGDKLESDFVILTAPIPQVEVMGQCSLPSVSYSKCILFIGEHQQLPVRIEMDPEWSERYFELSEAEILTKAENYLERKLANLNVKKWRYGRVTRGLPIWFFKMSERNFVAGDAFDPERKHDLSASWLSGLNVSRHILEKNNV